MQTNVPLFVKNNDDISFIDKGGVLRFAANDFLNKDLK